MKKLFTSLAICLSAGVSMAQIGAVAPDFTVTDINGTPHSLYSTLNSGKLVIIDVSATWCGPCWGFHTAHYLEDIYAQYGPAGTDQVEIWFYEGDAATASDALNGTGGSTQGDWVTGTPYPIINETPLQLSLSIFAPLGYPTINVICPSDKKIKEDLWDVHAGGGTTAAKLQTMKDHIDNYLATCMGAAGVEENSLLEASVAPNPTNGTTTIRFAATTAETATVNLYSVSGQLISSTTHQVVSGSNAVELDLTSLEAGTYFVKINSTEAVSKMIPVVKK